MASSRSKALKIRVRDAYRAARAAFVPIRNDLEPLFICGAMGSGTTLITRLIDQHFHTAGVANETALKLPRSSPLRIRQSYRYRDLEHMSRSMFLGADVDPFPLRIDLLDYYRRVLRMQGEDREQVVIVDKAPNAHLVRTPALRAAFPKSKFLFIYRNPISAVEGLRRKWPICAEAPFDHVARFWVLIHETFERDTAFFHDDVIPVPYEALTEDSDRVLEVLERAVPLKRRTEPKGYTNKPNQEGFGIRNVAGGQIKVVRGVSQAAADRLEPRNRQLIEEVAGDTFERLRRAFTLPGSEPSSRESDAN